MAAKAHELGMLPAGAPYVVLEANGATTVMTGPL